MLSLSPIVDPARDVLNAHVRHLSRLVGWANIAVAVGVAMEGVELIHDAIAWIKRRRLRKKELVAQKELAELFPAGEVRPSVELHSDHPGWVKRFTRIGLIVVVAGVMAEWKCGAKLEDAHNAVHEYDLAKLTEADQKAGESAKSAKEAKAASAKSKEDSAGAVSSASSALTIAKGTRREADSFEQDIVSAKEKAAKAEERTLKAESALLQFQERLQARRLSEKQKHDLVQRLSGLPKIPFTVAWVTDATDGQLYGEDFIDLFGRLGWAPKPQNAELEFVSKHIVGVFVVIHDINDDARSQGDAFLNAFVEVGIAAKPQLDSGIPEHSLEIRIGAKE